LTSLPLITDPLFYAVAIPAVFLQGLSKSGFGAGFGALTVPLLALAIPVPQAAALMMPLLFVMDILGLRAWHAHIDWKLIRFLLPWGLLGTLVGTFLFKALDAHLVAGIVGVCTLGFLAQRLLFPPRADSRPAPKWAGGILTTVAGFTSFVAHAGGPAINAYVLPMRLQPAVYTATMAVFFFTMNMAKWIPYGWLGLLDARNMTTSLALLPIAPIGVWVGVKVANRMNPLWFYRCVYGGMFLTGTKLAYDGFFAG
jgi:uncharacterized membrane protein YfcA